MLHITNGTSVSIAQTGLPGGVLAWRDVLHEGPTPAGLTLEQMTQVRARFLGDRNGDLSTRDAQLADFQKHEEVVLWFEHDLYDQLQLIQILDWFSPQQLNGSRLSMICIGEFPGKPRFAGLGALTPVELLSLFPTRHPVTESELQLGSTAWTAFCAPSPSGIEDLLSGNTSALTYLSSALKRHLEQFPSARNGLSRSEQQILEILSAGIDSFEAAFSAAADREEAIFLGDCVFWDYIERMRDGKIPLVEGDRRKLTLTPAGKDVLNSNADAIQLNGIDRWLGGVHLSGAESQWRWDADREKLVRKESPGADRR